MSTNCHQPTCLQRFFASAWPYRIWFFSSAIAAVVFAIQESELEWESLGDWRSWIWLSILVLLAIFLGLAAGLLAGWIFLGIILDLRGRINGGPFLEGDLVHILTGPHSGTVTRVYSKWQGVSVRVELGREAADTYEDVFIPTQLLRVRSKI